MRMASMVASAPEPTKRIFSAQGMSWWTRSPHSSIASTGLDDEAFAEQLLVQEQVAVIPGSAFGDGGRGYVRACYATSYADIERALDRIRRFVATRVSAK